MHIGLFTDCYYPQVNGVVTSVKTLEEELIKRGHKVTIVTVKVPGYQDESDNVLRIPSIPFNRWQEFRLGLPLYNTTYRLIKKQSFDIIHTHTEFTVGYIGKRIAKHLDIPMLHTYHTMYEDYTHYVLDLKYGKKIVKKFITSTSKRYVKKYQGVVAPSQKTMTALRSYGVRNDIFVVPTGVDVSRFGGVGDESFREKICQKHGFAPTDYLLLSLGRISMEKSIDQIITAMPTIMDSVPNTKLVIVGDGPYKSTLVDLVANLGLEKVVVFEGQVPFDAVGDYYRSCDVFVNASKTETQGLTILEAMASEIPIVVYDDTNIEGIVYDGVNGCLFKTSEKMSQEIVTLLSDVSVSKQLCERALETVQSMSKEVFVKNIEEVYAHLILDNGKVIKEEQSV